MLTSAPSIMFPLQIHLKPLLSLQPSLNSTLLQLHRVYTPTIYSTDSDHLVIFDVNVINIEDTKNIKHDLKNSPSSSRGTFNREVMKKPYKIMSDQEPKWAIETNKQTKYYRLLKLNISSTLFSNATLTLFCSSGGNDNTTLSNPDTWSAWMLSLSS